MDDSKIKVQIGANIAAKRKQKGWTQVDLADQLNYSDKAVSKWERGDSIPDVLTMMLIAEKFGVTVNDLIAIHEEPQEVAAEQKRIADRRVILKLTSVLVWFIAIFAFVVLYACSVPFFWTPFVFAIPVYAIVQLSLRSAWHDYAANRLLISLIVWGSLLSIFIILKMIYQVNVWTVFLLGIPGQIAIFLWFRMFIPAPTEPEEEMNNDQ